MRRTLADSTFLRVYAWLMLALVLTFSLAMLGYLTVDQVRREHYRERLASAPMALLTSLLGDVPADERPAWLRHQSERLGMQLTLHSAEQQDFNYFKRARLAEGRPLVDIDSEGDWHLWQRLPDEPLLLEATLARLTEQQLRGLVDTLRTWLEGLAEPEQPLQRLIDRQALPVTLFAAPPPLLDDQQHERLARGEVIVHLQPEARSVSAYARSAALTDGSPHWIQVGPVTAFQVMPPTLILGLILATLSMLAVAIYLIVRGVE
ncbi:MAG TPA: two-component sensor histidine kinase, partial [Modicisalibacter sp.]|nr:two-component sensor histidine kinase [Modicisalibacter sp.]